MATKGYGERVVLYQEKDKDVTEKAISIVKSEGHTFLDSFNDEILIIGYRGKGLDIIEKKLNIYVIFCPIGIGVLISGVAIAFKDVKSEVKIIGVLPGDANPICLSLKENKLPEI